MDRRRFLAVSTPLLGGACGCLSIANPHTHQLEAGAGTPTGTFQPFPDEHTWRRALDDTLVSLESGESVYVGTGSSVSRISPEGDERWTVETPWEDPIQIYAAGDAVYVKDAGGTVTAREPETGTARWNREVERSPYVLGAMDDAVFVGTSFEESRTSGWPTFAFEAESGEQRWRTDTGTAGNAAVTHGLCLVRVSDQLSALDLETGRRQWRKSTGEDGTDLVRIDDDTAYVFRDDGVKALALPSGEERWDTSRESITSVAVTGNRPSGEGDLYVAGYSEVLYALKADTGGTRWSIDTSRLDGRVIAVIDGGRTVVAQKGMLLCGFDPASGTERWRTPLSASDGSTRTRIIDGTVFVLHESTSDEAVVETYDLETGRRGWRHRLDAPARRWAHSPGQLLVATENEWLYGFSLDSTDDIPETDPVGERRGDGARDRSGPM